MDKLDLKKRILGTHERREMSATIRGSTGKEARDWAKRERKRNLPADVDEQTMERIAEARGDEGSEVPSWIDGPDRLTREERALREHINDSGGVITTFNFEQMDLKKVGQMQGRGMRHFYAVKDAEGETGIVASKKRLNLPGFEEVDFDEIARSLR